MKQKAVVYAIIVVTLLLSGWIGWKVKERLGRPPVSPETVSSDPKVTVHARYVTGTPETPDSPAWKEAEAAEVPVGFQVLALPWSSSNRPPMRVRALRNAERIFFLLEWADATEDRQIGAPQRFADAAAVMFPLKVEQPVTLMMGFLGPAEIWQWKADWDQKLRAARQARKVYADFYPFDSDPAFHPALAAGNLRASVKPPSAVEALVADGPGTVQSKKHQRVDGRGAWKGGSWRVVMSRALTAADANDYAFATGERRRIAFAVWDGAQGERGARKSISEWVWLELAPPPTETAVAGAARR